MCVIVDVMKFLLLECHISPLQVKISGPPSRRQHVFLRLINANTSTNQPESLPVPTFSRTFAGERACFSSASWFGISVMGVVD